MPSRVRLFGGGVLVALALSGCPVTDNYYIDANASGSHKAGDAGAQASGGSDTLAQGGKAQAGSASCGVSAQAGTAATGGSAGAVGAGGLPGMAGASAAGAPDLGQAGGTSIAGAPSCVPTTERCNGHDDDCNDLIDELSCNSAANGTTGCSGFVVSAYPTHGYMLCTGATKDYSHAQEACVAQNMRLAWFETSEENTEVSKKVDALTNDVEVWIGANDIVNEGKWYWDGGVQFWNGNESGKAVNGAFEAWAQGAPNNDNNIEDCGELNPMTAAWGDRVCGIKYSYLCEERDSENM